MNRWNRFSIALIVVAFTILLATAAVSLAGNNQPWHALQEISTTIAGTISVDQGNDGKVDLANRTIAPRTFQPPSFDSGWMEFDTSHNSPANTVAVSHNLGGDAEKYAVDITCNQSPTAPNADTDGDPQGNLYHHTGRSMKWLNLNATSIALYQKDRSFVTSYTLTEPPVTNFNTYECTQVRVRIWKNQY